MNAPVEKFLTKQEAKPQPATEELKKLRCTVQNMDSLSQGGFSEISSIAKLALSSLETPDGYRHLDDIANALAAIWGKAQDIQNCINGEAGEVGCSYADDAQRRRWDAESQARQSRNLM
jgi:hypothetical protein